jgi:exosortase
MYGTATDPEGTGMATRPSHPLTPPPGLLVAGGALGLVCLWSYWPTLTGLARRWASDPQYSHGYLVPAFALALLVLRAAQRRAVVWRPSWLGVPVLLTALVLRLVGAYIHFDWLEAASLLVCLAGLFALLGGAAALKWAWPAVAFLLFMVPLPHAVERGLAGPLCSIATAASTYALQTIGLPAVAEAHTIRLGEVQLKIVEACSGLSMLVVFVALSTAVAIVVKRPLLDRVLIAASALPVAVVANVTRITVTGMMHEWVGHEIADLVFHDLAGWLMMPYALALLGLELWLLNKIFVEEEAARPMPLAAARPPLGRGLRTATA